MSATTSETSPDAINAPTAPAPPRPPAWALHRHLYNWVLSLASYRHATVALFIISFAESSFFPIPPDVLLIPMAMQQRRRAWWFAFVCTAASTLGGVAGYFIGYTVWAAIAQYVYASHLISHVSFDRVMDLYHQYGFWIIFAAGFTPLPYKVFTITAGVFSMSLPIFIIASIISRGARFFLFAGLMWKFGEPVKTFIDKYFNIITVVVLVFFVAGFLALRYL